MKIKLVIRNIDSVSGPTLTKTVELPFLPPVGMIFPLRKGEEPMVDEGRVDEVYCELDRLHEFDAEVWLTTDDDEGIEKLKSDGWVVN